MEIGTKIRFTEKFIKDDPHGSDSMQRLRKWFIQTPEGEVQDIQTYKQIARNLLCEDAAVCSDELYRLKRGAKLQLRHREFVVAAVNRPCNDTNHDFPSGKIEQKTNDWGVLAHNVDRNTFRNVTLAPCYIVSKGDVAMRVLRRLVDDVTAKRFRTRGEVDLYKYLVKTCKRFHKRVCGMRVACCPDDLDAIKELMPRRIKATIMAGVRDSLWRRYMSDRTIKLKNSRDGAIVKRDMVRGLLDEGIGEGMTDLLMRDDMPTLDGPAALIPDNSLTYDTKFIGDEARIVSDVLSCWDYRWFDNSYVASGSALYEEGKAWEDKEGFRITSFALDKLVKKGYVEIMGSADDFKPAVDRLVRESFGKLCKLYADHHKFAKLMKGFAAKWEAETEGYMRMLDKMKSEVPDGMERH